MRIPKYFSASNIFTFFQNREEYYSKYISENRIREPQTPAMALGSAFDARIKAYLHRRYVGTDDPKFEVEHLFEAQVEEQCRDALWDLSNTIYRAYIDSGALRRLCIIMDKATDIDMEYRLEGEIFGVPFCGYPDLSFTYGGRPIIFDFKVNGYYAKAGHSPKKYYVHIEDGKVVKPSRGNRAKHKDAILGQYLDMPYTKNYGFDSTDQKWAFQMMCYHWMKGVAFGERPFMGIEQIVCAPNKIRVAQFRGQVSEGFSVNAKEMIQHVHKVVTTIIDGRPHIFENLSKADSDALCALLDMDVPEPDGTQEDIIMNSWGKRRF